MEEQATYTAFAGQRKIASGGLVSVLTHSKEYLDGGGQELLLIFDDRTGAQVEFDFAGGLEEVVRRALSECEAGVRSTPPKAGRPKLGVISREISLLPRHWEWLERQPGSVSGALRQLVERASKAGRPQERARMARDAVGKFMWGMAGDLPNFEDASRALYARDQARLEKLIRGWPKDVREHVKRLSREALRLHEEAQGAPVPAFQEQAP